MALDAAERQRRIVRERDRAIVWGDARIGALTGEITRLRRVQSAARSERMTAEQRALFAETLDEEIAAVEAELAALQARSPVAHDLPSRPQRTPIRHPLPEHLERIETRHEAATCTCPQCQGALTQIGDQISEHLACKPLEFFVRRAIYPQYACRACEQVVAEPVAPAIIERGQADASVLARWSSPSTSTTCRCTGRKRSMHAAASSCRGRPWLTGSAPSAWPCNGASRRFRTRSSCTATGMTRRQE